MTEETEITTISAKGQVVIPQALRERLKLKPKTKLLVYGEGDTIIMKRLHLPDAREEWAQVKQVIEERNKKYGSLSEEDVKKEVEAHRSEKSK
jgi:AbrB family looped-hinge helix DNA binding protein